MLAGTPLTKSAFSHRSQSHHRFPLH
jgi:hypothetical protein